MVDKRTLLLVSFVILSMNTGWTFTSICRTTNFRSLPLNLQGEHMCHLFELIENDVRNTRMDAEHLYGELFTKLNAFESKMDKLVMYKPREKEDFSSARRLPEDVISFQSTRDIPLAEDCAELYNHGVIKSGVYPLRILGGDIVVAYCDMNTAGGGWTVLQRRVDGSVNFTRNWDEYARGFGNPNHEYWLGNIHVNRMTTRRNYTLRIDLTDWDDITGYAEYTLFKLGGERQSFQLSIGGYTGTIGDSMTKYHHGMRFSTMDSDNDEWSRSCAKKDKAGWWYKACGYAQLNGEYHRNSGIIELTPDGIIHRGVLWYHWKQSYLYSLRKVEMKIRPFKKAV
ncbi:fibrinogen-like protein 1 [Tubulanus polymorphus]|uniref:fibrinogen-like protein 1 n=1 Tax=Tubulanus polymorphus TaxID=672921 RepID=UPI003DA48456